MQRYILSRARRSELCTANTSGKPAAPCSVVILDDACFFRPRVESWTQPSHSKMLIANQLRNSRFAGRVAFGFARPDRIQNRQQNQWFRMFSRVKFGQFLWDGSESWTAANPRFTGIIPSESHLGITRPPPLGAAGDASRRGGADRSTRSLLSYCQPRPAAH
jgi:hypothetical protein